MKQLNRILIANRGEIAVRIMRTCREMGIETVAAHALGEEHAMHVGLADHDVALGGNGYLDAAAVVAAAQSAGADAIHPGYGFLAEDPALSSMCTEHGLVYIGPPAAAIAAMADKARARKIAAGIRIPLAPAIDRDIDVSAVVQLGEQAGWPLIIKAVAGGGGRGARVVRSADGAAEALAAATAEAQRLFANGAVVVERYLENARHVEIQVVADGQGGIAALGTRDCSVQRRHQKVLEEAPAVGLAPGIERELTRCATELARAVDYRGVGTVEFLVSGADYYFLEMNTRIQVEHPVTEEVYGVDLVRAQVEIARGEALSEAIAGAAPRGHAIELRLNAEDPEAGFAPSGGLIERLDLAGGPGVRVDSGFTAGQTMSAQYDGLIAKLIVWAPDRATALDRLATAAGGSVIEGVRTTLDLGGYIARDASFRTGPVGTRWLEETLMPRYRERPAPTGPTDGMPDGMPDGRPDGRPEQGAGGGPAESYGVWIADRFYRLPVTPGRDSERLRTVPAERASGSGSGAVRRADDLEVRSPMQGTVTSLLVRTAQPVSAGDPVVAIEAMKLENRVLAEIDAVIDEVLVAEGDVVQAGQAVVRLRPSRSRRSRSPDATRWTGLRG